MNKLDIQDYLDATSDASSRTRTVTIVLVIASVIALTGVLNSLRSNWMLARIQGVQLDSTYYALFKYPQLNKKDYGRYKQDSLIMYQTDLAIWKENYKNFKNDFASSATKAFIDNSLFIRVPFFGIVFDVNDLGLFAGIGFIVILILLNFCLSREVNNLCISFQAASDLDQLNEFYTLLAMKQVFTVPRTQHLYRSKLLILAPKILCWLPFLVYTGILWQDVISTFDIGSILREIRNIISVVYELLFMILITALSIRVTIRFFRIDKTWEKYTPVSTLTVA